MDQDAVTAIVDAVSAGAAAALKDSAKDAVKTAYQRLKGLLSDRSIGVSGVEGKPQSETQRDALKESLRDLDDSAAGDEELLDAAQQVVDVVVAHEPSVAAAIGVNLAATQAEFIRIKDVIARGDGVRMLNVRTTGGIDIQGVRAGVEEETGNHPPAR